MSCDKKSLKKAELTRRDNYYYDYHDYDDYYFIILLIMNM